MCRKNHILPCRRLSPLDIFISFQAISKLSFTYGFGTSLGIPQEIIPGTVKNEPPVRSSSFGNGLADFIVVYGCGYE